ncbi:MAG TPA: anti-sigma-F factor Fin family protein [Firmicutes bacterium]|nr:anti-sigma-F factor Fin family protein [Bacillota bacterium]
MKVTYICDLCGFPQETVEIGEVDLEKLGLHTLTPEEREDIIKYNEKQGLLLYTICSDCFSQKIFAEDEESYLF